MDKLKNLLKFKEKNNPSLETFAEYKRRWWSICVIYVTIFLMTMGFSMTLTAVWPYLEKVDPSAEKQFVGFIIAASPLAQMVASPVVGLWANRIRQSRIPLIATMILFALASVLYAVVNWFSTGHRYWLIVAKLLVGVSSGKPNGFLVWRRAIARIMMSCITSYRGSLDFSEFCFELTYRL